MAKILLTAGPIPARLDSVKFLTNRFKGGLAAKAARALREMGDEVVVAGWRHADLPEGFEHLRVDDVVDYRRKVLDFEAGSYVLSAAVANLMPSNPWEGKFPSHNFKVGEKFNVEFEIAPRVIDEIKKARPRSALVGYKLFDGAPEELEAAAKKTLFESGANIVFANHPAWAKERKLALTQDGASFECSFDEHVALIHKVSNARFYSTSLRAPADFATSERQREAFGIYPRHEADGRCYGTLAVRCPEGFLTTSRGKRSGSSDPVWVRGVDHRERVVYASAKATLNAPLLARMLELNPGIHYLAHGHELIGEAGHSEYEFAGSDGDLKFARKIESGGVVKLERHGYLAGFATFEEFASFCAGRSDGR